MGFRDGPGCRSWLQDTWNRMLRRPDCALTIDRRHPTALILTHKAPVSIITGCQSMIIEYGGCGMVCFFRP